MSDILLSFCVCTLDLVTPVHQEESLNKEGEAALLLLLLLLWSHGWNCGSFNVVQCLCLRVWPEFKKKPHSHRSLQDTGGVAGLSWTLPCSKHVLVSAFQERPWRGNNMSLGLNSVVAQLYKRNSPDTCFSYSISLLSLWICWISPSRSRRP